ncbi:MAG: GHKL domain-containing protein [Oscillospiraceae bacterium]|nr:GHKL domain-containing protein [Oscillospiraceae bacterium]
MAEVTSLILEMIEDVWFAIFVFMQLFLASSKKAGFTARVIGVLPIYLFVSGVQEILRFLCVERGLSGIFADAFHFLLTWEWLVVLVCLMIYMRFCFSCSWNMLLFSLLSGFCAQEIMFGVWALVTVWVPSIDTYPMKILAFCVEGACLTVALYFYLATKMTPRNIRMIEKRSLLVLLQLYALSAVFVHCSATTVIFLNVFFNPIKNLQNGADLISRLRIDTARMSSIYANLAGNVLILFALRNMLRFSETELEREMLAQIREQDRKQYAHFRDNVDYINTKSHDLRHYFDLLQQNRTIAREELERVSESLQQLDSETDSGNETLDLILTDRRLACNARGIELIFQTDGTRLEQLDVIDTYAVFCNILDNAIGYVKDLPPQERCIRLGIRTFHSMVFIHQENPLVGELKMKDGLPTTTQNDETIHGFGLKSVQNTVKKRGGELMIRAENNRFELDICFPQGSTEK